MVSREHITECLERLYRAGWMSEENWREYFNFLVSRGLDIEKLYEQVSKAEQPDNTFIEDTIAKQFVF